MGKIKKQAKTKRTRRDRGGISPRWVAILRLVWILIVTVLIALALLGWQLQYRTVQGTCDDPICAQADIEAAEIELLGQSLGLSPAASAALNIGLDILAIVPYFILGFILFSRNSSSRLIWLGAFMLPTFAAAAVGTAIFPLVLVPNWIGMLAKTISILGQITFVFFIFLFPDGRFVPRWTFWLAAIWAAVFGLSIPLGYDPFGIISGIFFILFIGCMLGSQIYRYRMVSGPVEKQQTKWVVIGLSISLGGFLLFILVGGFFYEDQPPPLVDGIISLAITLLFALIPVWIGIAITRYRLWDVEVIVNRALIYGPLSATLAGIFAASIALINLAAKDFFGTESTATATVVAALFVATIFTPLRTRIETWVNKRFYPDNVNLIKEFIEFSPEVRSVIGLKHLLAIVAKRTTGLVNVEHTALLLARNTGFRRVAAYPSAAGGAASFRPNKAMQTEFQKGHAISKGDQRGLWVPIFVGCTTMMSSASWILARARTRPVSPVTIKRRSANSAPR